MNPAPPRLESLQAYRAIAAISVVLLHIGGKFAAMNYYGAKAPNEFEWGKIGVDFFFVLSGFIIAQSMQRSHQHSGNFLLHRALRIYPPFWLAFFVTLPVALLLGGRLNSPVTTHPLSLACGAMLLPQSIDPPVIGVAWTLQHELLFYLLAGLFLAWPRVVLSAATVLLLFSVFGVAGFPWDFLTSPLNWEFVMGVAAALLVAPRPFVWNPTFKISLVVEPGGHVGRLPLSLSTCPPGGLGG